MLLLATAEVLLDAGLAADHLAHQHAAATGLYLATVTTGGIFPVRSAWQVLARRRLSIGTLLVAGTIGALALGVFSEAAMLVVVFSLGGLMEDYVADRARGSIRALMSLTPPAAARLRPTAPPPGPGGGRWSPAIWCWCAPGSGCRPTGRSPPGHHGSTRARSPANRSPPRPRRARRCSAAPSTAPAR